MYSFRDNNPFALASDPPLQESYDPRLDPALAIEHPVLAASLHHYRQLCAGREMPLWSDFAPKRMPPACLPHFLLMDVTADEPRHFRWRLMGTHVLQTLKRDTTGRTFGELYEGRVMDRMAVAPLWVIANRKPLRTRSSGSFNRPVFRPSENLFLPFAGSSGAVTRILLVLVFDPLPQD